MCVLFATHLIFPCASLAPALPGQLLPFELVASFVLSSVHLLAQSSILLQQTHQLRDSCWFLNSQKGEAFNASVTFLYAPL